MDKKRLGLVVGAVLAVVAIVVGGRGLRSVARRRRPAPRPGVDGTDPAATAAEAFAEAWQSGTLAEAPVTPASGNVADLTLFISAGLTRRRCRAPPRPR